jgi:hypothetical protein
MQLLIRAQNGLIVQKKKKRFEDQIVNFFKNYNYNP